MHTRSVAVALLISLAPVTLTSSAVFAQGAQGQGDPSINAARARFQEGVDFYDKGQYENARASFLQAYALRKHPAVLLNLAQSSLRSNHALDAARYFQQYLRESTGLTAAQRTDAEKGLAESRQKLGHIEVTAPAGVEIFVDGERVGTAPLAEPVDVEPGSHVVKARTDELKVDVASGQRVNAKFGATGASAVPIVVAPPVAPPPVVPVAATPAPVDPATAPLPPPPPAGDTGVSKGPGSTPLVIGIAGAGLLVVGGGIAIGVGVLAKSSAQNSADNVASEIRTHGGTQGICSSSKPADVARFGPACSALASDNSKVDTDALVGNIGGAVAIVGAAAAIGGFIWYFSSRRPASKTGTWQSPTVTPIIGTQTQGFALSGSF